MDEYFITKKAVEIILANINDYFIKCLISLSVQERYADDSKVIIGIIELLKTYMETRRNDILSSCIKYTNKSYYLQLTDSLFRLIQSHFQSHFQSHLTIARYVFISDLISKYEHPVMITRRFKEDETINRFCEGGEDRETLPVPVKDAGTLFKDAYHKLKHTKVKDKANDTSMTSTADIELQIMKDKNSDIDLL
jgi:hypothetical protein